MRLQGPPWGVVPATVKRVAMNEAEVVDDAEEQLSAPVLAGILRRLIAGAVDGIVVTLAAAALVALLDGVTYRGAIAFVVVQFAFTVAPMAITGRPLGAVVARTVVVRVEDHAVAGWTASILRWLVAHLPAIVVSAVVAFDVADSVATALAIIDIVAFIAIYGAILVGPLEQGLHDRFAGTLVVLRDGDNDAFRVRQRTRRLSDPRDIAVDAYTQELRARDAATLAAFAPEIGFAGVPELDATVDGIRIGVLALRHIGSTDALFMVFARDHGRFTPPVSDGFAVRDGTVVDDLTGDEWGDFD